MRITFCVSKVRLVDEVERDGHIRYLYFAPLLLCHSKLVLHDLSDSIQGGLKKFLDLFAVHSSKFSLKLSYVSFGCKLTDSDTFALSRNASFCFL
jgi:hypothetical protein